MKIDFPGEQKINVETTGSQSMRVELLDSFGIPFCCLDLSLIQAMAIARHIALHRKPNDSAQNGWELE